MQQTNSTKEVFMPQSNVPQGIAITRLVVGLLQGCMLYFLYHASQTKTWPATDAQLFSPLLLVLTTIPVLLVSSLGHIGNKAVLRWLLITTVIIAAVGFYDIWRSNGLTDFFGGSLPENKVRFPSALVCVFSAFGLFIAHSLVLAGAQDRQRIAHYPTYFEIAWKLLIQIQFSALFVGVLWLVLTLGAALFDLIKLPFLRELLQKSWFAIPVTVFAFSCAMHITDVRPAIVRGIRSLLLVLLSWILPVAVLIVGGFLLSLPFTGLSVLWATRHATAILLWAAACLIIFINATFQNGEVSADIARLLRTSARIAAILLLPITAIAIYSLGLRVQEYGWTTDRIIAAACLLVATCYTLGYGWAAAQKGVWLAFIAKVNVVTAMVILAVLLALFSPVADPARLSIANQLARLNSGTIKADKFDFSYLKFEGGRYGMTALQEMKTRQQGADAAVIREKAVLALNMKNRWETAIAPFSQLDIAANIHAWPASTALPVSFMTQVWNAEKAWQLPHCLHQKGKACDAYQIDVTHDHKPEIFLIGSEVNTGAAIFQQNEQGKWEILSELPGTIAGCGEVRIQLQKGSYQILAPTISDFQIGDQRISLHDNRISQFLCAKK